MRSKCWAELESNHPLSRPDWIKPTSFANANGVFDRKSSFRWFMEGSSAYPAAKRSGVGIGDEMDSVEMRDRLSQMWADRAKEDEATPDFKPDNDSASASLGYNAPLPPATFSNRIHPQQLRQCPRILLVKMLPHRSSDERVRRGGDSSGKDILVLFPVRVPCR